MRTDVDGSRFLSLFSVSYVDGSREFWTIYTTVDQVRNQAENTGRLRRQILLGCGYEKRPQIQHQISKAALGPEWALSDMY